MVLFIFCLFVHNDRFNKILFNKTVKLSNKSLFTLFSKTVKTRELCRQTF